MDNKGRVNFKISDLWTVPNILTYCRFILIIPFVYYFLAENYIAAAISVGLSALSDCFDGLIARKFNQVTALGKILDPIADKATLFAVVICMVIYVPTVLPVLIVLVVKDLAMLLGGMVLIKRGIAPSVAKWYGKLGTILFYVSVCLIVFLKAVFDYENFALDFTLLAITAVVMIFALIQYANIFFDFLKEDKENKKKNS